MDLPLEEENPPNKDAGEDVRSSPTDMSLIKTFLNLEKHLMQIHLAVGLVEAGGSRTESSGRPARVSYLRRPARGSCDSSDHVEEEFEIKGAPQASGRKASVCACACVCASLHQLDRLQW